MLSNKFDIKKPELINDKWVVFKNEVFDELDTLDCDDTIEGKCYEDKTFDQCVDICDKSHKCTFGYYISRKNNSNLCVPLKTHSDSINISYRLRNQNIYPELDDTVVKTFLDKNVYQFPPADANTIFYMDNFLFENVETNTIVNNTILSDITKKSISKVIDTNDVILSSDGHLIIHMLEIPISLAVGIEYVPVKYGDKVAFNIPTTNLIMRPKSCTNTLEWISRSFNITQSSSFTLIPLPDSKKKIGDFVSYSDTFSIQCAANVFILGVNEWNNIEKYYIKNYKEAKIRNKNVTFRFKPQMKGWYCNNKKPEIVSFDKMTVDENGIGTYNGMKISRYPDAFGMCKNEPNEPNEPIKPIKPIILLILLIIFIIFITIYILCKKNCNKN